MLEIDNINYLRKNFPHLWSKIDLNHSTEDGLCFEVVQANNGLPTLMAKQHEKILAMHSKYDPIKEAERIIDQYPIDEYDHVFFYGLGLGYHIEAFIERFPDKSFSVYEPCSKIFSLYLESKSVKGIFNNNLFRLYIEKAAEDRGKNLNEFVRETTIKKVLLIFLPSYERVFKDQFESFVKLFKEIVVNRKSSIVTDLAFEKRWIINSLLNLPEVLKTPNVLHDLDTELFKDKPALIVSAGPSLEEDLEQIRYIKDNGLAYVFSVGSAISVLINNNIYPHAACTYDPKVSNQQAFEIVNTRDIRDIPLIFGSSVGFETIANYIGQKVHFITGQDTVTPYVLNNSYKGQKIDTVNDAPSIAVITLQILYKLGFNPIILAGQNLAFKDNKRYSQGIAYIDPKNKLTADDLEGAIEVEDVFGNKIYTSKGFNDIRKQIEMYVNTFTKANPDLRIINTTNGGARIEGTDYKPIKDVIKTFLSESVVIEDWLGCQNSYDISLVKERLNFLSLEVHNLSVCLENLFNKLKILEKEKNDKNEQAIKMLFPKIDKDLQDIYKNKIYNLIIKPMNRVEIEMFNRRMQELRFERNQITKAEVILNELIKYVYICKGDLTRLLPAWDYLEWNYLK